MILNQLKLFISKNKIKHEISKLPIQSPYPESIPITRDRVETR